MWCAFPLTWINESPLVMSNSFATPWTIQSVEFSRPEWVAVPFSRRSSQSRDWTQVSHITSRFFSSWATREAQMKMWRLVLILLWKYFIPKFQISCFSYSSCSLITATPDHPAGPPLPQRTASRTVLYFSQPCFRPLSGLKRAQLHSQKKLGLELEVEKKIMSLLRIGSLSTY